MGIAITVSLVAVLVLFYLKFPQSGEESCNAVKQLELLFCFDYRYRVYVEVGIMLLLIALVCGLQNFDLGKYFLSIFHHANKGHFDYQIISFLWKGMLLEGSIGSRKFASAVLKLLLTTEGMIVLTVQGWQLLGAADVSPSICHGHLWRILFGMYGFLLHTYQNWNALVMAVVFTVDLGFVYVLYPVIPLSSPACGTLAGLLCFYVPQLLIRWWNAAWSCVACPLQLIEVDDSCDTTDLVWNCQYCPSKNGVFFAGCENCGEPHRPVAYDNSVMDDPQRSLISRISNPELPGLFEIQNSDKTGLVWNCMYCPFENGVFVPACARCGTPRQISN